MSELSPRQLMQLHDGELDAELEAELLSELARQSEREAQGSADHEQQSACAPAQLEGLEQLGDFIRSAAQAHDKSTQYTSLADQVMAALDQPALKLVPKPAQPSPHTTPHQATPHQAAADQAPGADIKPAQPERGWVLGVGVLLAAAAAGLLWLQNPLSAGPADATRSAAQTTEQARPQGSEALAPSAALPAGEHTGLSDAPVAIVSVDFGGNDGTIFVVGEESTPVVWLADELPIQKTKMGPL